MGNIQVKQTFLELEFDHNESTNFSSILAETILYEREYANDQVLVHQVLPLSSMDQEHRKVLVILNITRDLNNLGEKISY
ncbi:hypothetical protein M3212_00345 [Alkalihalobacillus oceani]|uniref:hypothetical protein n=1 Tax=Halalkalibacter oceani TaxID=1653776 RepID=UPI00203CC262|nr:hypothetical protein [Halalkalibacter oceani]MCM3759225.1 hypothetical protein [Halalkalibacter oceani]